MVYAENAKTVCPRLDAGSTLLHNARVILTITEYV